MKNSICFFIIIIIITKVISNKSSDDNKRKFGEFLNFGSKKLHKSDKVNLESEIDRPKIDVLGDILKEYIEAIKIFPKLDIVFLIDSSSSIGEHNFKSELKFVKKLLSDVIVDYNHTRVAVVAFSSSNNIVSKCLFDFIFPRTHLPNNNFKIQFKCLFDNIFNKKFLHKLDYDLQNN